MCCVDEMDFSGSLKILDVLEILVCSLISETKTVLTKGVFWCWFLTKWEQLQSLSGQSKILLPSLILPFYGFVSPPLGLTFLTAQSIKISMTLKDKRSQK